MARNTTQAATPQGSVDREEFESFKKEQADFQSSVLSLLEGLQPKTAPSAEKSPTPTPSSGEPQTNILNSQYRAIFEKYFDPIDGFDASLTLPEVDPENIGADAGGILFTIIVPRKFSNASNAYLTMHGVDLRTRALQPNNIAKGIDEWCRKVAKNIGYNKLMQTK